MHLSTKLRYKVGFSFSRTCYQGGGYLWCKVCSAKIFTGDKYVVFTTPEISYIVCTKCERKLAVKSAYKPYDSKYKVGLFKKLLLWFYKRKSNSILRLFAKYKELNAYIPAPIYKALLSELAEVEHSIYKLGFVSLKPIYDFVSVKDGLAYKATKVDSNTLTAYNKIIGYKSLKQKNFKGGNK